MSEVEVLRQLLDFGTAAIFLWLYLQERKRSTVVQEERIKDLKEMIAHMTGWDRVESNQAVKTQHIDSKLELLEKL